MPFFDLVEVVHMLAHLIVEILHRRLLLLLLQETKVVVISVFTEIVPCLLNLLLMANFIGPRTRKVVLLTAITEPFLGLFQSNPLLEVRVGGGIRARAQQDLVGWCEPLRAQTKGIFFRYLIAFLLAYLLFLIRQSLINYQILSWLLPHMFILSLL